MVNHQNMSYIQIQNLSYIQYIKIICNWLLPIVQYQPGKCYN